MKKKEVKRKEPVIKSAHYLTETTSAYKALEKFKSSKVHYALATNEHGLVLGIVPWTTSLKPWPAIVIATPFM